MKNKENKKINFPEVKKHSKRKTIIVLDENEIKYLKLEGKKRGIYYIRDVVKDILKENMEQKFKKGKV